MVSTLLNIGRWKFVLVSYSNQKNLKLYDSLIILNNPFHYQPHVLWALCCLPLALQQKAASCIKPYLSVIYKKLPQIYSEVKKNKLINTSPEGNVQIGRSSVRCLLLLVSQHEAPSPVSRDQASFPLVVAWNVQLVYYS